MAKDPTITLGALNITADPHPAGVYRQLFTAAANKEVHLRGSDYAKITEPQDRGTSPPSPLALRRASADDEPTDLHAH